MIVALFVGMALSAQPQPAVSKPPVEVASARHWQGAPLPGTGILYLGRCLVKNSRGGYDSYSVGKRRGGWANRRASRSFLPPKGPPCIPDYGKGKRMMVF
jgi:hypothetical protein